MITKTDILIIGAGITGLSCAYHLKRDFIIFEREGSPGGLCQTDEVRGFYFDKAEHFIRVPSREVSDFFKKILGGNFFRQRLVSSIYYDNRFIPYPFQKNLYYLSDQDKFYCLKGFIKKAYYNDKNKTGLSFGSWILKNYGEGIAKIFMFPYNHKIWQVSPFKMRNDFSFSPKLIPEITLEQMLKYTLLSQDERNEDFILYRYYPKEGGIGELPRVLASNLKDGIRYNKSIVRINLKRREAIASDGTICRYNTVISTIPLVELGRMIEDIPTRLRKTLDHLKYSSVRIFNFALKNELAFKQHWIYFPEKEASFARMYFLKNFNNSMCPGLKSSLSVIVSHLPNKKIDLLSSEDSIKKYLIRRGFLSRRQILFTYSQFIKYGMPIPTLDSVKVVDAADRFLISHSIKTLGRYGLWKYQGIEHAVQDGQNINSVLLNIK